MIPADPSDADVVARAFDYPRLRENLWQIDADLPTSLLRTPDGTYEVATTAALTFLQMRSHCTRHNSVSEIGRRSGLGSRAVLATLVRLDDAGVLRPPDDARAEQPPIAVVRERLAHIVELWSMELNRDYIANRLLAENLPKSVFVGWLLETYHYVRDFPDALAHGAARAPERLRPLLSRYASEERGHEEFVVRTLVNVGLTRAEIVGSRPLVSTRLIGLLLRELFEIEPAAVLLVAALVEAQETPDDELEHFTTQLEERYDLPPGAVAPYVQHQAIDSAFGHARLFSDNAALFETNDVETLDVVVDRLHDLKHAFELQSTEIMSYYGALDGKYLPRQPVEFGAI